FSKAIGEPQLYLEISRGLPHNVTTEMDLFLWKTAQDIQADTKSALTFADTPALQLATGYQRDALPSIAQQAIAEFMSRYGMRGLGEIDFGRKRWREEPIHIIQTLQSYLTITDPDLAPSTVFARGAVSAEEAGKRLETKVRQLKAGKFKSRLVRWAVRRYRALAGLREAPKFFAIQMLGIHRKGLLESGASLVAENLLEKEDDLFFLKIHELEEIGEKETVSEEIREKISVRRELRAREMRRKQLPRVLLSDGTAFYEGLRTENKGDGIFGDPVSPGVVEGRVRVVLNPHETQLQVGEILVCPGTDPAWTPLFLAAGGLVMEVGGLMTHGSVVAREYGIPAVVGVHEATTRLETGMMICVDGSSGVVEILEEENDDEEKKKEER
ncbi:MAG: phosphoenolpyruvate synthase, partial [Anaerolineae bacterium]|nr:phosphoenolpyruvate synthase [Anaerolineae bacterium]